MPVDNTGGAQDGSRESGGKEGIKPPRNISGGVTGGVMGNKGVVAKGSHEDFEMRLLQVMGGVRQPNLNGSSVFNPFPLSESHRVVRKVPIKTQKRYG